MQRSSWQMLQSYLVWQAGHPLIQQTVTYQRYTQRECRTFLLSPCEIIVAGGKCREVAEKSASSELVLP